MGIILASKSPRRKELLENAGITNFMILPARGEEVIQPGLGPDETVISLALQKAREVAALHPGDIVIGADTLVYLDGIPLGKPKDADDAVHILHTLSCRKHTVYTGIAVLHKGMEHTGFEQTDVYFSRLSDRAIRQYVATGEPLDKAGAYGIQGRAAAFIGRVDGDYTNVIGLPMPRLLAMLNEIGFSTF